MSDTTPIIVLSETWSPDEAEGLEEIYQGIVVDGVLRLSYASAERWPYQECKLPSRPFRMHDTDGLFYEEWISVATWLRTAVGEDGVIVIDNDHPLRNLIFYGSAACGISYCLRLSGQINPLLALDYAIVGNACALLFADSGSLDEFHRNYLAPYSAVATLRELRTLEDRDKGRRGDDRLTPSIVTRPDANPNEAPVRVLLVAYFSGPCRAVGVQRPNYWFEELENVSDGAIEVHMATAIDWGEPLQNLHSVPDFHTGSLLDDENKYPSWAREFVASERLDARSFNTLSYYWRYALETYFDSTDDHFDVVIISGNPFSCFDFAAYSKRRWNARVMLDYRDPFANNPRFRYPPEARELARYAERGYNLQADSVSVVNNHCVELVVGHTEADIITIPNGFDERVLPSVKRRALPSDVINIVHAGSFTHDRSPRHILEVLDPERHLFHHVGSTLGADPALFENRSVIAYGRLSYPETLGIVGGAHIGVVFLTAKNFETTTKLYDYLAMDIDVLLCTAGDIGVGAVADVLEGQERVYWCQDTLEGVASFLDEYVPMTGPRGASAGAFSRKYGTSILAAKILELANT